MQQIRKIPLYLQSYVNLKNSIKISGILILAILIVVTSSIYQPIAATTSKNDSSKPYNFSYPILVSTRGYFDNYTGNL